MHALETMWSASRASTATHHLHEHAHIHWRSSKAAHSTAHAWIVFRISSHIILLALFLVSQHAICFLNFLEFFLGLGPWLFIFVVTIRMPFYLQFFSGFPNVFVRAIFCNSENRVIVLGFLLLFSLSLCIFEFLLYIETNWVNFWCCNIVKHGFIGISELHFDISTLDERFWVMWVHFKAFDKAAKGFFLISQFIIRNRLVHINDCVIVQIEFVYFKALVK